MRLLPCHFYVCIRFLIIAHLHLIRFPSAPNPISPRPVSPVSRWADAIANCIQMGWHWWLLCSLIALTPIAVYYSALAITVRAFYLSFVTSSRSQPAKTSASVKSGKAQRTATDIVTLCRLCNHYTASRESLLLWETQIFDSLRLPYLIKQSPFPY